MRKSFKEQIYAISHMQIIIIAVTPTRFFHSDVGVPLKSPNYSLNTKKALGRVDLLEAKRRRQVR